ncbi:hypothetical protein [Escherichia coli]|uniref:hypothetical protein n=1 Tax=Escherichia coli TaxID=562 RepID=UPI001FCE9395|nr:hypothetical protein [Escherichia coli]
MTSKYTTNARKPGKEARHHIAVLRNLIMCESTTLWRDWASRASQQHRAKYTKNYAAA